jgi:hypothetical protein
MARLKQRGAQDRAKVARASGYENFLLFIHGFRHYVS